MITRENATTLIHQLGGQIDYLVDDPNNPGMVMEDLDKKNARRITFEGQEFDDRHFELLRYFEEVHFITLNNTRMDVGKTLDVIKTLPNIEVLDFIRMPISSQDIDVIDALPLFGLYFSECQFCRNSVLRFNNKSLKNLILQTVN
jgi:hypothetical protein